MFVATGSIGRFTEGSAVSLLSSMLLSSIDEGKPELDLHSHVICIFIVTGGLGVRCERAQWCPGEREGEVIAEVDS